MSSNTSKIRYLQLSDTTMLEYNMLNENSSAADSEEELCDAVIMTKFLNGRYAVFSPASYEIESADSSGGHLYSLQKMKSMNTINHLSVPIDKRESQWFTFFDNSLRFVDDSMMNELSETSVKVEQYAKYCSSPVSTSIDPVQNPFYYKKVFDLTKAPRWDVVRLYYASGYDFSDTYGVTIRISVERNDRTYLDLCNLYYDRGTIYKYIQYMASPIIFGNVVYGKYVDIKLPSLYDLLDGRAYDSENADSLSNLFDINPRTPIKISFAYTNEDDYTVSEIELDQSKIVQGLNYNQNTNCIYIKSNSLNGTVPMSKTSSDNLGVYLAEDPDYPFLEYCATWRDAPLTQETVYNFNRSIQLYDQSLVRSYGESAYEVDKDYEVELPAFQWVAVHQITTTFYKEDEENELVVAKTETYTMNQDFSTPQTIFKYRPVLFDEQELNDVVMVSFEYVMRLVNVTDGVQFTKRGTLSSVDIYKYFAKEVNIDLSSMTPYKVYNKLIESKQSVNVGNSNARLKTKYVKVFYDTTSVTLDDNGVAYGNREYVLHLSRSPKNYKFTFKQEDYNNNLKYLDLSDAYYSLYCRSNAGSEINIEPTYSDNMNLVLGELEFNVNSAVINKLYLVPENERYLSIIARNEDNTISTMFEMRFTFS